MHSRFGGWSRVALVCLTLLSLYPESAGAQVAPPASRICMDILRGDVVKDGTLKLTLKVLDGDGFFVDGLGQNDFRVSFEDRDYAPARVSIADSLLQSRVVIVIDVSKSMQGEKFAAAKEAVRQFIQQRGNVGEAMILTFDGQVHTGCDFTANNDVLTETVDALAIGGPTSQSTALYDVVYESARILSTLPVDRKAVVLVTDGEDTGSVLAIEDALRAIEQNPVRLYVVGYTLATLGSASARAERDLRRFAIISRGYFYPSPTSADLVSLYESLARTLRLSYLVECPVLPKLRDGKTREVIVTAALMPRVTARGALPVVFTPPPGTAALGPPGWVIVVLAGLLFFTVALAIGGFLFIASRQRRKPAA